MPHRWRIPLVVALLLSAGVAHSGETRIWETWDHCRLQEDKYFDGDSFHVKVGRKSAIIRLYFVDAPESDDTYHDRVAEQAAYFRSSPTSVLRAGALAKERTAHFLAQPFRVITCRQVAPGASRSKRFYGIVEQGTRRLDALLVEAGLARVSGEVAEYPDAVAGTRAARDLRALELKASQARRGLWSSTGFVESLKDTITPRGDSRDGTASPNPAARRINVNTATTAELESLPGIGSKMAELIIRARPLKDLADLDALPGFGPKKMGALRDLVSF
jgi:endonuclease YncB( thermonuclease family)